MSMRKALSITVLATGLIAGAVSTAFAENPYLDAKNWTGGAVIQQAMQANPSGVVQQGGSLRLAGFHLGKEAQYSLKPELAKNLDDKLVELTLTLNGEFVGGDSSFLALVERGSSPLTIFWNQQCYAVLFKSGQIEIQKHGKGTNPNLIFRYSDFPALGFKNFPVGKPVTITYGIIKDSHFFRMTLKVNGVDICKALDNKYGQTVRSMPNNVFMIGVIATNKESAGSGDSGSNVVVSDFKVL